MAGSRAPRGHRRDDDMLDTLAARPAGTPAAGGFAAAGNLATAGVVQRLRSADAGPDGGRAPRGTALARLLLGAGAGDLAAAAGNRATGGVVHRAAAAAGSGTTVFREVIQQPPGAADPVDDMILGVAARAIDNPLHHRLVMHYGHGHGAPVHLTSADLAMMDVIFDPFEWPQVSAAITAVTEEARAGATATRQVVASGRAVANGSLGQAVAHIEATVTADGRGIRCEGRVHLTDVWDFDPWSQSRAGRTFVGQLETILGWAVLPGRPFEITTDTVGFHRQRPGWNRAVLDLGPPAGG